MHEKPYRSVVKTISWRTVGTLDTMIVSYFVTGNGVSNISIVVYNMTKRTNPTINALSTLLILVVVLILVGVNVIPALAKKRHKKVLTLFVSFL